MNEQEKTMLSKQCQIIKPEDFDSIDIGIYECETTAVVWEDKTDILITCYDVYLENTEYEYRYQAFARYANQLNMRLDWIEEHKEYIQKIISEINMSQLEYGFEIAGKNFFDRLCLRKIEIDIDVQDEKSSEISVCMYIDSNPLFPEEHCHCIEVAVLTKEDGTYKAEIIQDISRLLLEIRDASKEKSAEVCEWAKNNGIFYAFDDGGNMLAVVKQQFCLSADNKLISKADDNRLKKERSALYFIWADWETEEHSANSWKGLPMLFGFVPKELTCEKGVFTITPSSEHEAVSGTFLVMHEALTMVENLYRLRGVTEEEIDMCYYTFLVEDHQRYSRLLNC